MRQNKYPLVSILIVTLRGGENLKKCLISVKSNNYKIYEVVIVNNGGGLKIERQVKKILPYAKIINLKNNKGFAEGNNIGSAYCRGKYILFLNDDTIVTPDLLKILVEFSENNNHVAVLQPKTIFTTGKLQSGSDFLTFTGFIYHYGYGKDPGSPIYNKPLYMYSANGNCMLVRKEIIEQVGLFDRDFYAYLEETDFCHRVGLAGFKIVYIPQAIVYHKGSQTSRILDKSVYLYHPYKNRLCAHIKNLNFLNLIKVLPILLSFYQLMFFYYLTQLKLHEALYIQKAIWWNVINLPKTLTKRRIVQKSIRKIDDSKYIGKISYSPRLSYYLHLMQNLERYRDDDLIENKNKVDKEATILVATFSPWISGKRMPTNGSVEPMINFFAPKVGKFVLIDQPYPGSDFLIPRIEVYRMGKKFKLYSSSFWFSFFLPFLYLVNTPGTHILFKLRDFFSVLDWCLRDGTNFNYFIGLESVNALAGILLKKLGFVKWVIYYVSDYSPQRYSQKWFNWLYLFLDRFAACHADYIWDVSRAIQPARITAGLDKIKSAPAIHVPNALNPSQIKLNPSFKIKQFSLVYMGTLGRENGTDVIISAMPEILKKYKQATLHIIGGGNKKDKTRLEKLIENLKLKDKVKLYGYILDVGEMSKIIRSCFLALAPYRAFAGSPRYYGDAGKIRAYAAAGVPIITTSIPPLGKEIAENGGAIVVKDTPNDFAKAVINVFSDHNLYLKLRKGAISFAKNNTWENTFNQAFKQMERY